MERKDPALNRRTLAKSLAVLVPALAGWSSGPAACHTLDARPSSELDAAVLHYAAVRRQAHMDYFNGIPDTWKTYEIAHEASSRLIAAFEAAGFTSDQRHATFLLIGRLADDVERPATLPAF